MPSIPAAGLAKALIVVTVSLHPGAAHHDPGSYTVRPGDTLSAIAARAYGGNWSASTGNGLLRRPAVHRADLARLRRRPVGPVGQPGHRGSADRRGPAGPRRPGHRRLARVRSKGLTPPRRHLPALGSHQRGQAGDAEPRTAKPARRQPPARHPPRPYTTAGTCAVIKSCTVRHPDDSRSDRRPGRIFMQPLPLA